MSSHRLAILVLVLTLFLVGAKCGGGGGPKSTCIPRVDGVSPDLGTVRVLVVGLDGADWRVLDPLIDAGYLPNIGTLVGAGVSGSLDCKPAGANPCFCPPVWTSLATGVTELKHGINQFHMPSSSRVFPAIWSGAATYGLTSTLVSYRATLPPEVSQTFVATETGLDVASNVAYSVWPWPPPDDPYLDDVDDHTKPSDLFATLGLPTVTGQDTWQVMGRDRIAMDTLSAVATDPAFGQTQLTMITIHSPDKSEHVLWQLIQPTPQDPIDEVEILAEAAAYVGPVFNVSPVGLGSNVSQLLETDAWLGTFLASVAEPYDYVVFVSDHGMGRNPDPPPALPGSHGITTPEALVGIFAVSGPGIDPAATLDPARTVLDVAPTLAYLLKMPVARNIQGCVMDEIFTSAHLAANPIYTVTSW